MLRAEGISKKFGSGATELSVLQGIDLEYSAGEIVGIYGASGSGKSTLLHILGGLDRPSGGTVRFDSQDIYSMNDEQLAAYRNKTVGFVFQFYHLLPEFSALENVMIPPLISGLSRKEAVAKAATALEAVGLSARLNHRPSELSGGEQQRVAIARATVMKPQFILADEPTGNLDRKKGEEILAVLMELNKSFKMGIIMVTHDVSIASKFDRKLELKDGRLV